MTRSVGPRPLGGVMREVAARAEAAVENGQPDLDDLVVTARPFRRSGVLMPRSRWPRSALTVASSGRSWLRSLGRSA